jgi:acyl-CoA dehydrogenase
MVVEMGLNFMYEFLMLSGLVQASILTVLGIGFLYVGVPMVIWSVCAIGLLWLYEVELNTIYIVLGVLAVVSIPWIRQYLISSVIMYATKAFKIFPKVSNTERAALEAGTVWMDKELFSGAPNMKRLMTQEIQGLSHEENDFLNGPVATLCGMVNDWEIQKTKKIPDNVWTYIKEQKFLGMIIPKQYGGLGLSAIGHSAVIEKIGSVSGALAISVMVPNSLGPAELLLHYGTKEQKEKYLYKLATGEEMPCFGLTEPTAGSDAGSMKAAGVIFKKDEDLYIRLNFEKRWITLAGISTVIGLAFQLYDPEHLLGEQEHLGITCALIPTNTPGIDVSKRHDPLGVPFYNCPVIGNNVEVPLASVIGENDGIGRGWTMLMDCLSAGRGISLPSLSSGGAQGMTRVASAFGVVREQFGMPIGKFEGIEEPLARIVGKTLLLKAGRDYTCGAIDQGEKPSVVSAIMKLQATEMFRDIVTDTMDIMGGAGITQGPRNVTSGAFKAAPIGITVEGANILTRTLIIFGQGVLRCHPFAYLEVLASESSNIKGFDRAFFGHIKHILRTKLRVILNTCTRGWISGHWFGVLAPYKRKLRWVSSVFALYADVSMIVLGGALKSKQKITGRLADILSYMYLATATMAYWEGLGDERKVFKPVFQWSLDYCFYNIQVALVGYLDNMSWITRWFASPLFRIWRVGSFPCDKRGQQVARLIQSNQEVREWLTSAVFVPEGMVDGIAKYDTAYKKIMSVQLAVAKIKKAIKAKDLPRRAIPDLIDDALDEDIISTSEAEQLHEAEAARLDAIQVDAFTADEYFGTEVQKQNVVAQSLL